LLKSRCKEKSPESGFLHFPGAREKVNSGETAFEKTLTKRGVFGYNPDIAKRSVRTIQHLAQGSTGRA